jgi:hypothetical protein
VFSLLQSLRDIPLAFVDTETTGASAAYGHRVLELGIVRMERGVIVGEYQQLIDPERRISKGITALTGITPEMVLGQPTFAGQLPAAMPWLRGAMIVGHNVRFDLSFLGKEFRRSGLQIATALTNAPVADTVRIARRRFGRGGNALQQQGGPMGLLSANPRQSVLPLELEEALEQKCPVMMEYIDADERQTDRMITPQLVRRSGGELLLFAHCHLRNDRRTFKLDRIVRLRKIDREAAPSVLVEATPNAAVIAAASIRQGVFDLRQREDPRLPGFVDGVNRVG